MWIVNLEANPNGSHNDHRADHIVSVPEGWAMIPDDFIVPDTFPFVSIESQDVIFYRDVEVEKEVTKTRYTDNVDDNGNVMTEEYTETEVVIEKRPYKVHAVTSMTDGIVPEPGPEPGNVPTIDERVAGLEVENAMLKAQINAQSDQMDFYEDCIAEMAMVVYA